MLGFKVDRFEGLASTDFQAFDEHKWGSNRFNLERMKTRGKIEALGTEWIQGFDENTSDLVMRTTKDHPHIFNGKQVKYCWTYLDRQDEEKERVTRVLDKDRSLKEKVGDPIPEHHFAIVGFGINASSAALFLRMHSHAVLDKRNFLARIADPMEQPTFITLLGKLGDGVQVKFGDENAPEVNNATGVDDFIKSVETMDGWFSIETTLPPDDPTLATETLVDWLKERTPPLLELWRYIVWSMSNDRLNLAKALKKEKKQKAKRMTGLEAGDHVSVIGGLLSGKSGEVVSISGSGRVKVQVGRIAIEMDPKLLRKG